MTTRRAINWNVIAAVGGFALQAVGTAWAVLTAGNSVTTRVELLQNDITHIAAQQDTTSAKVDFLYQQYVQAGFNTAFNTRHP